MKTNSCMRQAMFSLLCAIPLGLPAGAIAGETPVEGDGAKPPAKEAAHPKRERLPVEEVNPGKIVAGDTVSLQVMPMMRPIADSSVPIDFDRDGVMERVFFDTRSGLSILSEDGRTKRKFSVEDSEFSSQFVTERQVIVGDEALLLLAWYNRSVQDHALRIGLFKPDAKQIWSYKEHLPDLAMVYCDADVADLDGDGKPEVVALIGVSHTTKHEDDRTTRSSAALTVLDFEGKMLARQDLNADFTGFIQVAAPAEPGASPLIILQVGSEIRRYSFDPKAAALHPKG